MTVDCEKEYDPRMTHNVEPVTRGVRYSLADLQMMLDEIAASPAMGMGRKKRYLAVKLDDFMTLMKTIPNSGRSLNNLGQSMCALTVVCKAVSAKASALELRHYLTTCLAQVTTIQQHRACKHFIVVVLYLA
eukprot:1620890-Amphidinium_carterae.1